MQKQSPIVISIGGALIVPEDGVDTQFLRRLNTFIRDEIKKGYRFLLVAGGGRTARVYRDAGKAVIGDMTVEDLDWLGVHATRLNGHLLRSIFEDIAHPRILENYDKKLKDWVEPVAVAAGWKPGWSTDFCAVQAAVDYGADLLINLSNIDFVYDKDPRKYDSARPLKTTTWEEMEKLVGTTWSPGMNAPFDPIASQLAKSKELTVIVASGRSFANVEKILDGRPFLGTSIVPRKIGHEYYDEDYFKLKNGQNTRNWFEKILSIFSTWYRALLIYVFIKPKTVLDVGSGTGELVSALRLMGIDAYGCDVSTHALEYSPDNARPFMRYGDVTALPYDDNSYDLVVTFDVLEHIPRPKIQLAISECNRVSRKYVLHKIYTKENLWIDFFHAEDHSHLSVFNWTYWHKLFYDNPSIAIVRSKIPKLPKIIESLFLLKKK